MQMVFTRDFILAFTVDANGNVFAGTHDGVFYSRDGGTSWQMVNDGLTCKTVRSIVAAPDGFIYVGTLGAGVFRSPVPRGSLQNR